MRSFRASLWEEEGIFVAQCLDVDVASQGASEESALRALEEALTLHFTPPVATVTPRIATVTIDLGAA